MSSIPYLSHAKYDQNKGDNPTVFNLVAIPLEYQIQLWVPYFENNINKEKIWKPYYMWNC